MRILVQYETFDVATEIAALYRSNPQVGSLVTFLGLVREASAGEVVSTLTLEHYPGMTEKALSGIVMEAFERWDLIDVTVIHRVGVLLPTEPIVFVAVVSPHRGEGFAACEFIVVYLKTRAPFWKKETSPEGDRWVDARASDDVAAGRWQARADSNNSWRSS